MVVKGGHEMDNDAIEKKEKFVNIVERSFCQEEVLKSIVVQYANKKVIESD